MIHLLLKHVVGDASRGRGMLCVGRCGGGGEGGSSLSQTRPLPSAHPLSPHLSQLLSQRGLELQRARERSEANTLELECQRAENTAVQVR